MSGAANPPVDAAQLLDPFEHPPPDDHTVVIDLGYPDSASRIWDAISGQSIGVLTGHTGAVRACAISPGGGYIVAGSGDDAFGSPRDGSLRLWTPPDH